MVSIREEKLEVSVGEEKIRSFLLGRKSGAPRAKARGSFYFQAKPMLRRYTAFIRLVAYSGDLPGASHERIPNLPIGSGIAQVNTCSIPHKSKVRSSSHERILSLPIS